MSTVASARASSARAGLSSCAASVYAPATPAAPNTRRAVPVTLSGELAVFATTNPRSVNAAAVCAARPGTLEPFKTFTVICAYGTGAAPSGGHGGAVIPAAGAGVLNPRARNGTPRVPV